MQVARLHGPKDIRIAEEAPPPQPVRGEVLLRVGSVGVCGSDLHLYETGRIGYTDARSPFALGHEFMGVVEALGADAHDGNHQPLKVGTRMAVDRGSDILIARQRAELAQASGQRKRPGHAQIALRNETLVW